MSIALSASPYFISPAISRSGASSGAVGEQSSKDTAESPAAKQTERAANEPSEPRKVNGQALDEAALAELEELKARDREVRTHEAAHQSVGGQHAGSVSYTYSRGPDGVQYATGGEVPIDVSPVANNPQATIEKMRVVQAAALAPAEPSSQDRQVAAQAMQTMLQAQVELADNRRASSEEAQGVRSSESLENSRQGKQAESAYQVVSAFSDFVDSDPTTAFRATA